MQALRIELHEVAELEKISRSEDDNEMIEECNSILASLERKVEKMTVAEYMNLNSELNSQNCFMQIQAGAGGDDACSWVAMLRNMYMSWCSNNDCEVSIVDESPNDNVRGYRSTTLKISGTPYADESSLFGGKYPYGWLGGEAGVHRLVRISPFDPTGKRHTSFGMVSIYPNSSSISEGNCSLWSTVNASLAPENIRIDTFRSSGPGGQSVNKTDSAVRITHLATGITVACQKERSQLQNKNIALSLLKAKLMH